MRTRLELYVAIENLTAGSFNHLRQHIASIRPMLLATLDELGYTPALFSGLRYEAERGTHGELVVKCYEIHQLIRGKGNRVQR